MFPANFEFAPITSAITKLAIAVGHANKMNIIPKSMFLYPSRKAPEVNTIGIAIILISEAENASTEARRKFSVFREPPIPINARGNAKICEKSSSRNKHSRKIYFIVRKWKCKNNC